jgi:hypothetical protein
MSVIVKQTSVDEDWAIDKAPEVLTRIYEDSIQCMSAGDVALLKGELWEGNEERGIIHRSPALILAQPKRLVMTCDLIH